ncbi:MAG: hypothetical protein NTU85_02770 [Candidatus Kaiserbacteria bacterium]|nr:hypothetical protein [Candidatus Kaiserbacteria bacterium]
MEFYRIPKKVQEKILGHDYKTLSKMGQKGAQKAAEQRRLALEHNEKEKGEEEKKKILREKEIDKECAEMDHQANRDIVTPDGEDPNSLL